jgi:hypothetical protein
MAGYGTEMKLPEKVVKDVRSHPEWLPFTLADGWVSTPDEGDHTHCQCRYDRIVPGDTCLVRYLEYVSITFCMKCFRDNEAVMRVWMRPPNRV